MFIRKLSTSLQRLKKFEANKLKSSTGSANSNLWLSRQLSDPYVEKAKRLNYRCRSAFKLIEINEKHKILNYGQIVIDCGASPGSWTQYAVKQVNATKTERNKLVGQVLAVDKQQIYPIEGATIFGGVDFTKTETQSKILAHLDGNKANVVLSDMAPNATGVRVLDYENMLHLVYMALRFAVQTSVVDGTFLVKLWECGELKQLERDIEKYYNSVKIVKPKASRTESAEIFILARNFKGIKT